MLIVLLMVSGGDDNDDDDGSLAKIRKEAGCEWAPDWGSTSGFGQ